MGKAKTAGKIIRRILLLILILILALAAFIAVSAHRNMKIMNETLDQGMETLSSLGKVTPVDAGEYSEIKMYGVMKFHVSQYEIESLGNLSVMTVNMGFMQMASYVITPFEKEMPLLSMDFMYILGNRKAYAEFYDLVPDKSTPEYQAVLAAIRSMEADYADLADIEATSAWYDGLHEIAVHKGGKRADDARIRSLFSDAIRCCMEQANTLEPIADEAEKAEKIALTQEYSDNLVTKGGVSTDVFKKVLGEDTTRDFFNKVFFGTARYTG